MPADREPRIYVLPNLMTAGNLLCGFMAILHIVGRFQPDLAGNERYHWAIGFILVACLFDLLDGRLARVSGQSSDFGREFDSLADIVSFGIAPALLVHDIVLGEFERNLGGLGWMISCGYLVCGAMRLARFNCLAAAAAEEGTNSKSFRGCPIPAAAGVIVSLTLFLLWMDGSNREVGRWKYALPALMVLLSYLMVSSIEYPSFKSINLRTRRSFHWVLMSIVLLAFTVKNWQWMPMVLFVSYLGYGLIRPWISRRLRQEIEIETAEDAAEEAAPEEESTAARPRGAVKPPDPAASI